MANSASDWDKSLAGSPVPPDVCLPAHFEGIAGIMPSGISGWIDFLYIYIIFFPAFFPHQWSFNFSWCEVSTMKEPHFHLKILSNTRAPMLERPDKDVCVSVFKIPLSCIYALIVGLQPPGVVKSLGPPCRHCFYHIRQKWDADWRMHLWGRRFRDADVSLCGKSRVLMLIC